MRDNIEAYALDALDSFDRGIVEHHLRWCESCREIAAAFESVVNLLPYASAVGPSPTPETKIALMQRVRGEIGGSTLPVPAPSDPPSASTPEPVSRLSPWWRYASAAMIAPLALALVIVGVWANTLRTDLNERDIELDSQVQLNAALSNGGQVDLYSVEQSCPTCQGSGQLGVSESNDMGMVVGWNFDPSQQHDVWGVNSAGEKKKVCQLHIDATGAVMQMFNFPEAPSRFTDVYITSADGTLAYVSHLSSADTNDDGTPSAS